MVCVCVQEGRSSLRGDSSDPFILGTGLDESGPKRCGCDGYPAVLSCPLTPLPRRARRLQRGGSEWVPWFCLQAPAACQVLCQTFGRLEGGLGGGLGAPHLGPPPGVRRQHRGRAVSAVTPWPGPKVGGRVPAPLRTRVGLPRVWRPLGLKMGEGRGRRPRPVQAPPRPSNSPARGDLGDHPSGATPSVHPAVPPPSPWPASPHRRLEVPS